VKLIARVFLALALLVALAAAAGYAWLRQSLPQIDGTLTLSGLGAPVEIVRDRHGVPHIYAGSVEDAYFGLGFAHAQDRLWQMEMNRRIGSGRLSEALGAVTLDADKFLRTLGVRRAAESSLKLMSAVDAASSMPIRPGSTRVPRAAHRSLAAGIRAHRRQPRPWHSADSAAWIKMMAWDLSGNWRSELLPAPGESSPPHRSASSCRPIQATRRSRLPTTARSTASSMRSKLAALALPGLAEAGASNNWVVAGSRERAASRSWPTIRTLAAAPAVWYFAHLSAPGFEVMGATLPGVPGVVLGRNRRIAWGLHQHRPGCAGPVYRARRCRRPGARTARLAKLVARAS
jgi:penicillin amidase